MHWITYIVLSFFITLHSDVLAAVPEFVPMDFTIVPKDTAVVPGQWAMLSCSALYNGQPPDVYSWERNTALLSMRRTGQHNVNKLVHNNGSIVFTSIMDSGPSRDPGVYRCIAEKIVTNSKVNRIASPEANLILASTGVFTLQPANVALSAGEDAMFECVTTGYPSATYLWTKDGRRVTSGARVRVHGEGEALEILSLTSSDEGTYQCQASNMAGVINSTNARLTILSQPAHSGAPQFLVRPRDVSTRISLPVRLYCSVYGRGPDDNLPTLSWLREGSTIDIDGSGGRYERLGRGSLLIANVTPSDQGKYTCRGDNSADAADAEVSVTVLVPPHFVTRPSNTYARVNGDAELQCDIRGYPQPRIYWLKDSAVCTLNQYFRMVGGNLRIMGLMPSDSGYYQCIGENSVGKVYGTAQLLVLDEGLDVDSGLLPSMSPINSTDRPDAPTALHAVIVSHTYVSLKWNSSAGASGYTVSVVSLSDRGSNNSRVRSANTTRTDYTMQGLQSNTNYLFKVSAFNRHGRSFHYGEKRVRTSAEAAVPSAVRDVKATLVTHNAVHVTWVIPIQTNGDIIEYRVYYYSIDQSLESNVSSTLTSARLEGLDPYVEYHIRVVAFNGNGEGMPSEELAVWTLSAKPSMAPLNVAAEVTGTNSIILRWEPPPTNSINGQLTGYKVRCRTKDSSKRYTTDADARDYEVTDLEPGTLYMLRVGAVNINGTGQQSSWVEALTYAAQLDESRPPGRPLRLTVEPFARELIVRWIPANESILVAGYKLGYGTITPDSSWMQIGPNDRFTSIENLQPKTNYVMQLFAFNSAGEGPRIEQQVFTTEERFEPVRTQAELLPPVEVNTLVMSSTSIIVRWYDRTLGRKQENSDGRFYTVKYNAVSGTAQRRTHFKNTTNLIATLERLRPFTEYEFSVMLTKGSRTSHFSFSVRNRTLEDAPGTAPEDLTIHEVEGEDDYLFVSWQPPSQPNGRITQYLIYSNTDKSQPLHLWAADGIPGHTMNHRFGPITSSTIYHFVIKAQTSQGLSPPSKVVSVRTADASGRGASGFDGEKFDGHNIRHPVEKTTTSEQGEVTVEQVPTNLMERYPYLLWIIIACVATITIIAIAVVLVFICVCRRRTTNRTPAKQPSAPEVIKPAPPDLWRGHEHEINGMRNHSETDNETDEMTSMLQSNFDVSVSMAGDVPYHEDPRFSSISRGRPVIIASNPHKEGMPRATVTPMTSDPSRPLYPRTQFAGAGQFDSTPRVHVGDTSQPSAEHYHQPHHHSSAGGTPTSPHHSLPQSPSSDKRGYAVRNSHRPPAVPSSHVPKHAVKPQPAPQFRMTNQMTGSTYQAPPSPRREDEGSIGKQSSPVLSQRGPRESSESPSLNHLSTSRDNLKSSMMTQSTEQLSAEMAHLDTLMQEFNAIKTNIEMT